MIFEVVIKLLTVLVGIFEVFLKNSAQLELLRNLKMITNFDLTGYMAEPSGYLHILLSQKSDQM